jgi:hypothetical protein
MESTKLSIYLLDYDSGAEIEGIPLIESVVIPRVGEMIHWWQDGLPGSAGVDSGLRRDFVVMSVLHDWRFMPQGRSKTVLTIELRVRETKAPTL